MQKRILNIKIKKLQTIKMDELSQTIKQNGDKIGNAQIELKRARENALNVLLTAIQQQSQQQSQQLKIKQPLSPSIEKLNLSGLESASTSAKQKISPVAERLAKDLQQMSTQFGGEIEYEFSDDNCDKEFSDERRR